MFFFFIILFMYFYGEEKRAKFTAYSGNEFMQLYGTSEAYAQYPHPFTVPSDNGFPIFLQKEVLTGLQCKGYFGRDEKQLIQQYVNTLIKEGIDVDVRLPADCLKKVQAVMKTKAKIGNKVAKLVKDGLTGVEDWVCSNQACSSREILISEEMMGCEKCNEWFCKSCSSWLIHTHEPSCVRYLSDEITSGVNNCNSGRIRRRGKNDNSQK